MGNSPYEERHQNVCQGVNGSDERCAIAAGSGNWGSGTTIVADLVASDEARRINGRADDPCNLG
jgi:hypothetical protein